MVLYVEQPQPALLAEGKRDKAAELDQLRLGEVTVQAFPEVVAVGQPPGNGLRICERRLFPVVESLRGLEVQQVVVLGLVQALFGGLDRALVAAVLAVDRARDVHPAQLLDAVVAHAGAENALPGTGERPEAGRHVGPDRAALRPGRSLPPAPLHPGPHLEIHLLKGHIADALPGSHRGLLPPGHLKAPGSLSVAAAAIACNGRRMCGRPGGRPESVRPWT